MVQCLLIDATKENRTLIGVQNWQNFDFLKYCEFSKEKFQGQLHS